MLNNDPSFSKRNIPTTLELPFTLRQATKKWGALNFSNFMQIKRKDGPGRDCLHARGSRGFHLIVHPPPQRKFFASEELELPPGDISFHGGEGLISNTTSV